MWIRNCNFTIKYAFRNSLSNFPVVCAICRGDQMQKWWCIQLFRRRVDMFFFFFNQVKESTKDKRVSTSRFTIIITLKQSSRLLTLYVYPSNSNILGYFWPLRISKSKRTALIKLLVFMYALPSHQNWCALCWFHCSVKSKVFLLCFHMSTDGYGSPNTFS